MKQMTLIVILISLILASLLLCQEEQTFYLKNGQKVMGTVIEKNDSSGVYTVETSFGIVKINKADLKVANIVVKLRNGDMIKGELLDED